MDYEQLEILTDEAALSLQQGEAVRALAITDQVEAGGGDSVQLRIIRAHALLELGSAEEALGEAQVAVQMDREDNRAIRAQGLAAWQLGKRTLAQNSLEQAIELSNNNPILLAEYAWFLATQRGARPAERAAKFAIEADAESSTAWAALGLAQSRLGRPAEARQSGQKALELDPNNYYAQTAMLALLESLNEHRQALALASLVEESSGAEGLVEAVRARAQQHPGKRQRVLRDSFRIRTVATTDRRSLDTRWLIRLFLLGLTLSLALWNPLLLPLVLVAALMAWRWDLLG